MAFHGDLGASGGRRRAWLDSVFADHSFFRFGWTNFAEVVPGRVYRSNHPTPWNLARFARRVGLRTVVNLRGDRACGSQALSQEAAGRLGLTHVFAEVRSRAAPARAEVARLAQVLTTAEAPLLLHCKSGADRAGLAAAVAVLVHGGTAAQALRQLSLRFGHFSASRTGILDAFIRAYATQAEGRLPFLDWVAREYDADALLRDFRANAAVSAFVDRVLRRE